MPRALQTPEFMAALEQAAAAHGIPLDMLSIGNRMNRINPNTGAPEFGLLSGFGDWLSQKLGIGAANAAEASPAQTSSQQPPYRYEGPEVDEITVTSNRGIKPEVYGPEDPETLRRAHVIFGETSGVYPALVDPKGNIYNPDNWNPASADELARARAYIGVVSARNKRTHSAIPDLSNALQSQQWNRALEAARASRAMDKTLDPNIGRFFLRQAQSNQRIPITYDNLTPPIGPFTNVGGGDVPRGNRMYFDYFRK